MKSNFFPTLLDTLDAPPVHEIYGERFSVLNELVEHLIWIYATLPVELQMLKIIWFDIFIGRLQN
jgi:hypothetical protein